MSAPELDKTTLRLNATRLKIMNKGGVADQVYTNNYLFNLMKEEGAIKVGDFGRGIEFDMLYQGNQTAKNMNRYEKYTVEPGTEFKPAVFDIKKTGGTAVCDTDTIDENTSDEKVWAIVEEKTKDALAAVQDKMETNLNGAAVTTKDWLGLRDIIADDPTQNPAAYNVGGIDRSLAANAFWRNQYNTSAGLAATISFATDGKAAFREMFATCKQNSPANSSGKAKETSVIYCHWDVHNAYEAIHDTNDLHVRSDSKAGSGYEYLVYRRTIPLAPGDDSNISGRAYFINLSKDSKGNPFFGLYIQKASNFSLGKWIEDSEADVLKQKIKVRGTFGGPYMKTQGVIYGIS